LNVIASRRKAQLVKANSPYQGYLALPMKVYNHRQLRLAYPMSASSPRKDRAALALIGKWAAILDAEKMLPIPLQANARKSTTK
jgi:hypothetical protein